MMWEEDRLRKTGEYEEWRDGVMGEDKRKGKAKI